jgi:murein DD-endopeptidase MepM/ murein hydrolase activator NlpD
MIALAAFLLLASLSGLVASFGGSGGSAQVDAGGAGIIVGAGRPLPPGTFTVSQGFGCSDVGLEPPPPHGYSCPPDGAHLAFVRFHTGIDLAAAAGVLVFAVTAGTVHVIESQGGFGVHILLTPLQPGAAATVYLYGHLSGVAVPDGDLVRAGEPIGFVGSTGNSSGPHLHFEVDVGGVPQNPCSTFPPGYLRPAGVAAAGCVAWAL